MEPIYCSSLSQQAQLTAQFRRNSRITSFIHLKDSTVYYAYFNINRQNYGHTKKTSDEQRTAPRQLFKTELPSSFELCFRQNFLQRSSNGKDGASKTLRTLLVPVFVQADGKDYCAR